MHAATVTSSVSCTPPLSPRSSCDDPPPADVPVAAPAEESPRLSPEARLVHQRLSLRRLGSAADFAGTYVVSPEAPAPPRSTLVPPLSGRLTTDLLRETQLILEDVLHVSLRRQRNESGAPWGKLEHLTSSSCSSTLSAEDEHGVASLPPVPRSLRCLEPDEPQVPQVDLSATVVFDIPVGLHASRRLLQRCFMYGSSCSRRTHPHACVFDETTGDAAAESSQTGRMRQPCIHCGSLTSVLYQCVHEHQRGIVPQQLPPMVIQYFT